MKRFAFSILKGLKVQCFIEGGLVHRARTKHLADTRDSTVFLPLHTSHVAHSRNSALIVGSCT